MDLQRFILVMALVAALGCVVGGLAGTLFGLAVPREISLSGSAQGDASPDSRSGEVTAGYDSDRSPVVQGAALGGRFGLLIGAGVGVLAAVIDQVLLGIRKNTRAAQP